MMQLFGRFNSELMTSMVTGPQDSCCILLPPASQALSMLAIEINSKSRVRHKL
eukprot:m.150842 g.150842  ORF g.150842 m.150842 type:complete len:53 (-) comp14276_c0_seq2:118-276(-)